MSELNSICSNSKFVYWSIKDKSERIERIWVRENKVQFSNFINSEFKNKVLIENTNINKLSNTFNVKNGEWENWNYNQVSDWIKSLDSTISVYHNNFLEKRIIGEQLKYLNEKNLGEILNIQKEEDIIELNRNINLLTKINYQNHQLFVSEYLNYKSPYKGLLLYHGLGSGKTAASILISEGLYKLECVIMLPASLKSNYEKELNVFSEIKNNYKSSIINKYHWCFHILSNTLEDLSKDKVKYFLSEFGIKSISNESEQGLPIIFNHEVKGYLIPSDNEDRIYDNLDNKSKKLLNLRIKEGKIDIKEEDLKKTKWDFININNKPPNKEIPKELKKYYKYCGIKLNNNYGIWLINDDEKVSSTPNYSTLTKSEQDEIDSTLNYLFLNKYKFIHYNSGAYLSKSIFKLLSPSQLRKVNTILGRNIDSFKRGGLNKENTNLVKDAIIKGDIENPFSNKVLIIDEIHNLISGITGTFGGSSYSTKIIYDLLMTAENSRIILLSGTPCINHPFEIAILLNILQGYDNVFKCQFESTIDKVKLEDIMKHNLNIDYYSLKLNRNQSKSILELTFTRNPKNFINKIDGDKKIGIVFSESDNNYDNKKDFINSINYLLKQNNLDIIGDKIIQENLPLFQDDKLLFSNKYIDYERNSLKSNDDFLRKCIGKISFFNETTALEKDGGSVFPDLMKEDPTYIYLSVYQFLVYCTTRIKERETEKIPVKIIVDGKDTGFYKVMSRNALLFSFPPEIDRIWPSTLKEAYNEKMKEEESINNELFDLYNNIIDNYIEENKHITRREAELFIKKNLELLEKQKSDESSIPKIYKKYLELKQRQLSIVSIDGEDIDYKTAKENMIKSLRDNPNYLTFGNKQPFDLEMLSPKYVELFKNIQSSPGLVLCYSQFKSVEGITIFSEVLKKNGYKEYNVKYDEDDVEISFKEGDMVRLKIQENLFITCRIGGIKDKRYYLFNKYEIEENIRKTCNRNKIDNYLEIIKYFESKFIVEEIKEYNKNYNYLGELRGTYYLKIDEALIQDDIFHATYCTWTRELGNNLLDNFNKVTNKYGQEITLIFISQSGAEGISLKHIRQVNIMEPFWNKIKLDQVIGRARRISSHVSLPIDQRNVKVYEYISKFTPKQLTNDWDTEVLVKLHINFKKYNIRSFSSEISVEDKNLTSDEHLQKISLNKELLISSFLKALRNSAIDCDFNYSENTKSLEDIKCINTENIPPIEGEDKYIYIPGKYGGLNVIKKKERKSDNSKELIRFHINAFPISTFRLVDTGEAGNYLFDLYEYFGLDIELPRGTFKFNCIGTWQKNHLGEATFYLTSDFLEDKDKISRYHQIEKVRLDIETLHPDKYKGIPKSNKLIIEWIDLIRCKLNDIKHKQEQDSIPNKLVLGMEEAEYKEDEIILSEDDLREEKDYLNSEFKKLFESSIEEFKEVHKDKFNRDKIIKKKLLSIQKKSKEKFKKAQEIIKGVNKLFS